MKILILGASGIIGQHMRLCCPPGITPIYVRRTADPLHVGLDLTDSAARDAFLERERPDVIINLAGESNTDVVERDPERYREINQRVPAYLCDWCHKNNAQLVHVSTQAVFSGNNPPYGPDSIKEPINKYGEQKAWAEISLSGFRCVTIVRPTFVLGVRPLPHVGRANPIEQMLDVSQRKQVNDRWFSVSFARDVAAALWKAAIERPGGIIHVGLPDKLSRFDIADFLRSNIEPVKHDSFIGITPRPIDTSYAGNAAPGALEAGLGDCASDWGARKYMDIPARAREIALFLGKREDECLERLNQGWSAIHNAVSEDWNAANPKTNDEILDWYRRTEQYCWELSWYHADAGFNYTGMCSGITERLKAAGAKKVLCLGDGIGDLTISLIRAGFDATYHDLAGSRTAGFAAFRSWMYLGEYMPTRLALGWTPDLGNGEWDAIVSLDFLEHCVNVDQWTAAIKGALKPGGLLYSQNAFAIGSGPDGSMPMHLACNDRFERDWDTSLFALRFVQLGSNVYQNPVEVGVTA